jgi:hypothetical protein
LYLKTADQRDSSVESTPLHLGHLDLRLSFVVLLAHAGEPLVVPTRQPMLVALTYHIGLSARLLIPTGATRLLLIANSTPPSYLESIVFLC